MVVEALTGRRPFVGRTVADLITAVLNAPFQLPGTAPETVALDGLLQKCLAKDREQRFVSVAAMKQELIPAIARCPTYAAAAGSSATTMIRGDATTAL